MEDRIELIKILLHLYTITGLLLLVFFVCLFVCLFLLFYIHVGL